MLKKEDAKVKTYLVSDERIEISRALGLQGFSPRYISPDLLGSHAMLQWRNCLNSNSSHSVGDQ